MGLLRHRATARVTLIALLATVIVPIAPASARTAPALGSGQAPRTTRQADSHTADPTAVTIAGSLQSELGCTGDWQPECATTHPTLEDGVWQGTFTVPAGKWEYKAALNDAWDENYGLHAHSDGANIPLASARTRASSSTTTTNRTGSPTTSSRVIAVAPGTSSPSSAAPATGSPTACAPGSRTPTATAPTPSTTTALPAGSYEAKVAINEAWDENYGAGGVPGGANIAFTVPPTALKVTLQLRRVDPRPDDHVPATATTTTSSGTASRHDSRVDALPRRRAVRSRPARRSPSASAPSTTMSRASTLRLYSMRRSAQQSSR